MKTKALVLSGLFLLILTASLFSLPAEMGAIPLQQDSAILSGKLANGLSYYIMSNPKPAHIAEMRLYIDAGSVNEDDDQRGLAHFTEHMAFNGTKNFGKSEVVDYLSSIGMGYDNGLNGMTTYDYTVYTFKIPTDDQVKLNKGLLILSDMASQVSFNDADIESERGVIIEEWRMGQDAASRIRDAQNAVCLAGSRYAERSPIGTYEVISSFKPETIKRFYKDWYRPDMQTVVIVGDFVPEDMLALVQQYFGAIPAAVNPRPRVDFTVPENITPEAVVVTDKEYPRNVLNVMWKKEVQRTQTLGDFNESLKRDLFYTMLNTRLDEHSKEANPPFSYVGAFEYPLLRTMSTASVFAMFTEGKSEQALSTILTESERVQRYGFLPSEFERAKLDVLRAAEQGVAEKDTRESDGIAWGLIDAASNQNITLSPDDNYQLVNVLLGEITLDEVNAIVGQLIPEKNMFISIGAPAKAGLTYPSEARLLEIAQTTNTLQIEPYQDNAVNEPLMTQIPAVKPVKKASFDKKNGIRKWVLANGVTVYSKKTDYKNDEVLLSAVSPGGYVQYPAEDVPAAKLVSGYIRESGFGKFNAVALGKATVGKVAQASVSVDLNTEGFDASCSPKDIELMFQLIHEYGMNPRFDRQDFASYIQRTKSFWQNRNLEPMNVFIDKMHSAMYSDNSYMKSIAEVNLDAINMDTVERIYRDRFGDFSDFSFIVVGNFDEEQLKSFCCSYLADLPAHQRKEKVRDVGIRNAQGVNEIRFNKGESDRSFVAHITNGDYKQGDKNGVLLDALVYVMNEKLRENIREQLSGVYFIQSWPSITNYPKPHYVLSTMMSCSPARVDELNAAIFATLDSIRTNGVDERYLVSARATLYQQFTENAKDNNYWLNQLQSDIWLGRPLAGFLNEPKYYGAITQKSLLKVAQKYLDFSKNKLSVIMLPEKGEE